MYTEILTKLSEFPLKTFSPFQCTLPASRGHLDIACYYIWSPDDQDQFSQSKIAALEGGLYGIILLKSLPSLNLPFPGLPAK